MPTVFNNFAYSTLAAAITTAGQSTATVQTGHGDRFPVVASPDIAYVTLKNAAGTREIVKITARAAGSDVLTIARGEQGTSATTWAIGDVVQLDMTAADLNATAKNSEYLTSPAGTNTVTAIGSVKLAAYVTGQIFSFIPANTNTGATTINVTAGTGGSALGAVDVYANGAACIGGELLANVPCSIMYDGTRFHVISRFHGGNLISAATVTAFAGATTSLTIGGTGASAVVAFPGTLDATSSTAAGVKTAGGLGVAKAAYIGTTLNVAGTSTLAAVNTSGAISTTLAQNNPTDITVTNSTDGASASAGLALASNAGSATLRATAPSYSAITGGADAVILNLANLSGGFQVSIGGAAADFKVTAGAVTIPGQAFLNTADATPVNGAVDVGLLIGSAQIGIYIGSGAPGITPADGSIYLRSDGGASTSIYVRNSGAWKAVTSAA